MTEPAPDPVREPAPAVDDPRLAAALEGISDLDARPLAEHHDRLLGVHEALLGVLHPDRTAG